jgi:hypothetical protein
VVFKIFASFGLCDHVHSFMAIVHLVCLLASHEWKDASQVQKSQILYLSSTPWFMFVKIFILGISSIWVWTRFIWKVSMIIITPKVETPQIQRSLKWKDFIIINLSQGLKWNEAWKFLTPSSNSLMSGNHSSLSSSYLWKSLKNPFEESLQYLLSFLSISNHFNFGQNWFPGEIWNLFTSFSIKSFLERR